MVLAAMVLAGCLGGIGPQERYIRLKTRAGECGGEPGREVRTIALKPLDSLPNLDRPAVLIGDGPVLVASQAYYWEGSPEEIVTQSLAGEIGCSGKFRVVTPYRPSVGHDLLLTGRVLSFEAQQEGARFEVSLRMDLWSSNGKTWIDGRTIRSEAPLAAITGKDLAWSAQQALDKAMSQTLSWLDAL